MKNEVRLMDEETNILTGRTDTEEFPLPVAEDWDMIVNTANRVADVIDKHLDFEEGFQGISMRPLRLCPEQKVSLATDISTVSK